MPQAANGHDDRLADLRRQLNDAVRDRVRQRSALPFGVPALDAHLPNGGLRCGALHEVAETGAAAEHGALACLFTAGILARLPGPVLWCLRGGDLFAPSLVGVGLMPGRIVFAETGNDAEALPAMEEGLRTRGLAAVVGEVSRLGLTASRRMQLAAERTGVMALVIRRWRTGAERGAGEGDPTVALTRWRVSPQPGAGPPMPGLPRARWLVELTRARGADAPRSWILDAPDATGRLRVPSDLVDRPVAAPERIPRAGMG
ncbi:ImuA family protein [Methylobacterium sp. J-068]|uniref:ImuA family protein n=1 Tax=Methylobacterium sp. J-068 TaxID=2836649 RepID=UPI001FBBA105|nr:damage-inducible mutagenesis protein [Methylobacterium sp. J-068]MCJ2034249.1 damage-inducible mutagenesis protein [Methylobacterium sp. J-068]